MRRLVRRGEAAIKNASGKNTPGKGMLDGTGSAAAPEPVATGNQQPGATKVRGRV